MAATEGSIGTGVPSKNEKGSRRAWTQREEEVFLACFKEVIAKGWKTENGFKLGYMKKLEIAMHKAFPGTDLKVDPHLNSRIQTWKKNYASLVTILSTSGVGFNIKGDYKVDCDAEQWEYFIRMDNNANKIRKGAWPLYEGWKEIFGKDRATGDVAEDVMEAVNCLFSENNMASHGNLGGNGKEKMHHSNLEHDDASVCHSSKLQPGPSSRKRKKKSEDNNSSMCALLEHIHRDLNGSLQSIASRIGISADLSAARKQVFDAIKLIPGLSSKEVFVICDKLILSPARLEFFTDLSEESRQEYVFHMLSENP